MGNTASGVDAYQIKLNAENRIGGGQYADVYKVQKRITKNSMLPSSSKFH
jgi:hypothetical protein